MRGVDRGDQLVGYYNIGRRSRKWWKQCFSYLIECSLLNAYVLDGIAFPGDHQKRGRSKSDFLSFLLKIAEQLLFGYSSRKKAGRPRSSEYNNLTRLNIELGHWPIKVEDKKDCKLCAIRGNKQNLPRSESLEASIQNEV